MRAAPWRSPVVRAAGWALPWLLVAGPDAASSAALLGCARDGSAAAPPAASPAASASPRAADRTRWDVVVEPGGRVLSVVASFAPGASDQLGVDDGAEGFVDDACVEQAGGAWKRMAHDGDGWTAPGCGARGCRVRYRFRLADAAASLSDVDYADADGDVVEAPPSTWILKPSRVDPGARCRLHVSAPQGVRTVLGYDRAKDEPDAYDLAAGDLRDAPYAAIGPLHVRNLDGSPEVELAIAPAERAASDDQIAGWASDAARAVRGYYGRFPVPHLALIVLSRAGRKVDDGKTAGGDGASVVIRVGGQTAARDFADDWVLTHEMVHTALPNLERRYHWLEEGLATYVEPLARARVGALTPEKVWRDMMEGMPQGQPAPGDRGLDETPTWGRTYWGGALFCLVADVTIRERTGGQRSLDDALRGILAAGGSIRETWPLERVLDEGDRATGVPVLRELHAQHGHAAVPVDLDALWKRLGVAMEGEGVRFDDGAPLASARKAMTGAK